MNDQDLDAVRVSVLDRMEQGDRLVKWATLGAAAVEAGMFAVAFLLVNWTDRLHVLLFVFFVLSYSILALGLVALGGHVSRSAGQIVAAIEARGSA